MTPHFPTPRRFLLSALTAVCAGVLLWPVSVNAKAQLDLAAEVQKLQKLGVPGVLAFVRDGDKETRAVSGFADVETKRRITGTEVWRIASVTKLVTAIIMQRLAEDGLLKLDDTVAKHLPKIVPLADRITVRQLLNHTSGIPDYLAGRRVPINVSAKQLAANLVRHRSRANLLKDANRQVRSFAPSKQHEYSNTNYLVLELLIEKLTEKTYPAIVESELIAPLDLKHTGFPDRAGQMPTPFIKGYVPSDGPAGPFTNRKRLIDVTAHDYFAGADGGLYSSISDLARMMEALRKGELLTAEELKTMISDLKQDHDGMYRYGLGVTALPTKCDQLVLGHEGRDLGIYTAMLATVDGSRQMIVVINSVPDYVPKLEQALADLRDRVFCD
jgi:D-alanyl-D-alanine carboxypeptidase